MKLIEKLRTRKRPKKQSEKIIDVIIIIVLMLAGIHVLNTQVVRGIGDVWVEGRDAVVFGVCVLVLTSSYFLSLIFNYLKRYKRWEKSLLPIIFNGISTLAGITGATILLLNI